MCPTGWWGCKRLPRSVGTAPSCRSSGSFATPLSDLQFGFGWNQFFYSETLELFSMRYSMILIFQDAPTGRFPRLKQHPLGIGTNHSGFTQLIYFSCETAINCNSKYFFLLGKIHPGTEQHIFHTSLSVGQELHGQPMSSVLKTDTEHV